MFRTVLLGAVFVLALVSLGVLALAPAATRGARVVSEPLYCQAFDQQVVCTDRSLHGEPICSRLDEATVYCTTRKQTSPAQLWVMAAAGAPKL